MGRISSSIGLATGLNITETVNQLVAIQGRTRDLLVARNKKVDEQRTALTQITAQLIALQISVKKFNNTSLYNQTTVTSSDPTVLQAAGTGTPPLGSYGFLALRQARAQQLQSSQFTSNATPLGAGTLKYRFGGFLDGGTGLDSLNAGNGFTPGKIRITDRSGAAAEIDLTTTRSVDDVLAAINNNSTIRVQAETVNGAFRLVDQTSLTTSNLKVEEVNGGTSAASLGLGSINAAATSATGANVISLFGDVRLGQLNDGRGVRINNALSDFVLHFRDGTKSTIDLNKLATSGTKASGTTTAAKGVNAQVQFNAVNAGPDAGGITVNFVDNAAITAGQETSNYNSGTKTLTFQIDEGNTTADQIIAALGRNSAAAAILAATRATGGNGTGLVTATDTVVTTGPKASFTTIGADSPHAKLSFTAVQPGAAFEDVRIEFIDDNLIIGGSETVTYDVSNPLDKKLTFRIDQGNTTANDIVDTLNNDPTASLIFTAANVAGSTGNGKVVPADNGYTTGGALIAATPTANQLTLQQAVDLITTAAAGKLSAAIVNNRLQLTDLTVNGGFTFSVEQVNGSKAAEDLGINVAASGASLNGKRIFAGLKTALLTSLNGGQGTGALGGITFTNRAGASQTLDFSAAETVDDVLKTINDAGLGIKASYNLARNGILLTDTTGSTASNLIAANADVTNSADKLGLTVNAAATIKNSGDLKLQIVSEATLLSSLNGGQGVAQGTVTLTDNAGQTKTLTVDDNIKSVGDLLDEINDLGLAITARVNDAGDGIVLIDATAGGGNLLKAAEGAGTTARDLHLLGGSKTAVIDGQSKKILDGSQTYSIELDADDNLSDLAGKINAFNGRVRATVFNDGSGIKPYRFNLFNQVSGSAGQLLVDTSQASFSLNETVAAQDALLQIGGPGGVLAASSSNTFTGILPDVSLTLKGTSANVVTVNVEQTTSNFVSAVKELVESYNRVRDRVTGLTSYNAETNAAATLQGDAAALRVEQDLNRLLTGRFFGAGAFQALESVGLSFDGTGKMKLDEAKLQTALNERPADTQTFFNKSETGFAAKLDKLIEQLAGVGTSTLVSRAAALTRKYESNTLRLEFLTAKLVRFSERLTAQFQRSETVIAKIQANLTYINQIQGFSSLSNTR